MKSKKGITLIALIITIVVLLILAGVSINAIVGENGILTQAQNASKKTNEAKDEEQRMMTIAEAAMNFENTEYKDKNGEKVTIPEGFAVSEVEGENTVEDGLVIIDSSGNEFVWIPVPNVIWDKEKTLSLDYTPMAEEVIQSGKKDYKGILYNVENYNINTKEIQILTTNNMEPALTPGSYSNGVGNLDGTYYRQAGDFSNMNEFLLQMKNDYNEMIESVKNNGGFYVARYEMSEENNKVQYQKNKQTLVKKDWYEFYKKQRAFADNNDYSSVKSSMIWGSQYDAIMNWIARNNIDITNSNEDKRNITNITGMKETDKILNIYDLLGNSKEYTLEAEEDWKRVGRGGCAEKSNPISKRHAWPPDTDGNDKTSRATLYLH